MKQDANEKKWFELGTATFPPAIDMSTQKYENLANPTDTKVS